MGPQDPGDERTFEVEVSEGFLVLYDVPIVMDDGLVLRADIFRPSVPGRYPTIMTHGPYAKGLHFADGFPHMWERLTRDHPEVLSGTTARFMNWETVDPEKWVPDGYVCIRVDSRGSGRSPGFLSIFSPRETQDYAACIEWAGQQSWSNGRVGLLGISYYAMNQWQVAALRPRHLAAICPWEGAVDYYRDFNRHGGILNTFVSHWYPHQVGTVQHGVGEHGPRDRNTGEFVAGPDTLTPDELARNREDSPAALLEHTLDGPYFHARSGRPELIEVPTLSATNWAHPLHTRGNFEAFAAIPGDQKWLEVHGLEHWTEFYTDRGIALQKRFFGHFLADRATGWDTQPNVQLNLRLVDGTFRQRAETSWPLARTSWTRLHLDLAGRTLVHGELPDAQQVTFRADGDGLTFLAAPFTVETEITGPVSVHLQVASDTTDADLFVVLRVLRPDGSDVTFRTAVDPAGIVGFGWLRASQRALDVERSTSWRPFHRHTAREPLTPDVPVSLDIEVVPTSLVLPVGHRLGVTILGRDFAFDGSGPWPTFNGVPMRGNGVFHHDHPQDRSDALARASLTLFGAPGESCWVQLPVVPDV